MSYSETEDGKVVLTLTRADYQLLLMALGYARGGLGPRLLDIDFINRLNQGNPDFRAYESAT